MFSKISNNNKELCSDINRKEIGNKAIELNFNSETILQGIILSEILGKPKARKGMVTNYEYKGSNSR